VKIFDSSFERDDNVESARHGKPWLDTEEQNLERLFRAGYQLKDLCEELQRPAAGTLIRLCRLGLLRKEEDTGQYRYRYYYASSVEKQLDVQTQTQPTTQETKMAAPTIETKTFIAGKDAKNMSDSEIFALIAELEAGVDKLSSIRNKPKKLVDSIEKTQAYIAKLVEYVDGR
jgi:hypothetical protein